MPEFRYPRRAQFAETDLAGIVHFSWMFRYMEEAEHALWRAAGLSVAALGSDVGWPRVAATFTFRSPLRFEDEFEVVVRLAEARARALTYAHTIARGSTIIGTGTMTSVCVRHAEDGSMVTLPVSAEVLDRLRQVLEKPGLGTRD